MHAISPQALGIHIKQTTRAYGTTIRVTEIETMFLTIFSNISRYFKIITSYSYLKNCFPLHQFYTNLKILLHGGTLSIKG